MPGVAIALRLLYGTYATLCFGVLGLVALVLVLLLPGLALRRGVAHHAARLFFRVAVMPIRAEGLDQLPNTPCVVVANHSSYLDGVLLKAVLPPQFSFVIKKEMVRVPLAGLLLRRIGSEFVDRVNRHSGGLDARRLIRSASQGQALAFFPEGTFSARVGIAPFHIGAFVTAARAGLPVIPLVIRGTREALPPGQFLPRPARLHIRVLEPLPLEFTTAPQLRDAARERILAASGEPDLAGERVAA